MESTLICSYAIGLTLDTPIDFAFSPRLIESTLGNTEFVGENRNQNLLKKIETYLLVEIGQDKP